MVDPIEGVQALLAAFAELVRNVMEVLRLIRALAGV